MSDGAGPRHTPWASWSYGINSVTLGAAHGPGDNTTASRVDATKCGEISMAGNAHTRLAGRRAFVERDEHA